MDFSPISDNSTVVAAIATAGRERLFVRNVGLGGWTAVVMAIGLWAGGADRAGGAQCVSLAWDASAGTNIAGYRIYYGVGCRAYTNLVTVGKGTTAVISGLCPGTNYYFVATSYDNLGLESVYSNEVLYSPSGRFQLQIQFNPAAQTNLTITATGDVPSPWRLEKSSDLLSWTPVTTGTNNPVAASLAATGPDLQFFRLVGP
ncbi:MAG: fibronectin type III domain-containing protein [Verrucomicrobiota bacterium]